MSKPPLLHPRTRIVNFRLTEAEYARLRSAAEGCGGASISEFARAAVLASAAERLAPESAVSRHLCAIEQTVAAIAGRLESVLAGAGAGN